MAQLMRAKTTFFWGQRKVNEGDLIPDTDLITQRNAVLFERIEMPDVEQATAAPGERRPVRRTTHK